MRCPERQTSKYACKSIRGSCDYVPLMPVVFAAGQVLTLIVLLNGKRLNTASEATVSLKPQPTF